MKPHRRNLLVLVLAAVVGVLAAFVWSTIRQHQAMHAWQDPLDVAVRFSRDFGTGDPEAPMRSMLFDEETTADDVRPKVALMSGLARLEGFIWREFGEGLNSPPLPSPLRELDELGGPDRQDWIEVEGDIAYAGPPHARLVLLRHGDNWYVDPRPFVDRDIDPDRARAMNSQLNLLTERVRGGEFKTRQEALDAYSATVFLGLLGGMGSETKRPATGPAAGGE